MYWSGYTRRIILILALFTVLSVVTTSPSGAFHLVKKWATDPVFDVPESVCWDFDREILYVSNIAGNPGEKDGEGFISRVSIDGEVKKLRWVTGLNAPKGMAVYGGKIYVSDIDELAVIDIRTDKVVERYPAEGAVFLNDVAADRKGNIYVSDSSRGNSVIYRFADGELEVWLRHKDIQSPNGLFVDGNRLVVGNSGDATTQGRGSQEQKGYNSCKCRVVGRRREGRFKGELYRYRLERQNCPDRARRRDIYTHRYKVGGGKCR